MTIKPGSVLKIKYLYFILLLFTFFPKVKAAQDVYLIRDSETEGYVREIVDSILEKAKIDKKSVKVFLLKDDSINAFVYGGANIFVNTGLIQSSSDYQMVEAVLAHEIGHISGSHILRFSDNANKAVLEALFYAVSGAALVLASGGGGAAILAGLSIGTNVVEKRIYSFTRAQEAEADNYAAKYLKALHSSGEGFKLIFEKFALMQTKAIDVEKIDKYRTTHPFPNERLKFIIEQFSHLKYAPFFNKSLEEKHERITAKLAGYFGNLNNDYSTDFMKNPIARKYFEAFSEMRTGKYQNSETKFLELTKLEAKNPFFWEALAEIQTKQGDFVSANKNYKKAVDLSPRNFGLLFGLAESYYSMGNTQMAIKTMNTAFEIEPWNPSIPFKLATYHNKKNETKIAQIYFLESEVLRENYPRAKLLLGRINKSRGNSSLSPFYLKKLQDIEDLLKSK
jgi:predicted Zn-dependent protease